MRCLLWWIMQSWSISWNYWWIPLTQCPAHWGISKGSRTLVQKIIPATTTVHPHRGILIGSRTLYLLKLFKERWSYVCIDKNSTIILTIIARFITPGCVIVIQAGYFAKSTRLSDPSCFSKELMLLSLSLIGWSDCRYSFSWVGRWETVPLSVRRRPSSNAMKMYDQLTLLKLSQKARTSNNI